MMGRLRAMRAPLKYVQGRDALLKFHEEMGYMGKRWLFVCSNSGYKAVHDKIEASFGDLDDYRRYEIFGGISSNGEVARMKAIVEEDNIDVVVAVGGGSAIDTAKATAYYAGKHIVIVPTVVATDAPCTGLSVLYNDDRTFDRYLFYPTNPDAIIVDSNIIAEAPVKFLIAGMGDALGTYFEGRASIRTESPSLEGTGITRSGQALARLCYETLRDYGKQVYIDSNFGIFAIPFMLSLLLSPVLFRSKKVSGAGKIMLASSLLALFITAYLNFCYGGVIFRYTADLTVVAAFISAAVISEICLILQRDYHDYVSRTAKKGVCVLTASTAAICSLAAVMVNGNLVSFYPEVHTAIRDFFVFWN